MPEVPGGAESSAPKESKKRKKLPKGVRRARRAAKAKVDKVGALLQQPSGDSNLHRGVRTKELSHMQTVEMFEDGEGVKVLKIVWVVHDPDQGTGNFVIRALDPRFEKPVSNLMASSDPSLKKMKGTCEHMISSLEGSEA